LALIVPAEKEVLAAVDTRSPTARWTVRDSEEVYGIDSWGRSYFSISADGTVVVSLPDPKGGSATTDLHAAVARLCERGINLPVLLRFPDILGAEISRLNRAFRRAMGETGYAGTYRGVFPIKVNQQQQIIEEIARAGAPFHHGLEAGSKAELLIALGMLNDAEALIVCNGYKDREFVDLALMGSLTGNRVVLTIERPGELDLILERSQVLGIDPTIGFRVKLSSTVGGNWAESGGDRSVFGLTASQVIEAVDRLRDAGQLDKLKLLHSHLGSQIPDIRSIRQAVREASRYYVSIVGEGAPLEYLNLGGGLAIDYDGSQTNFASSRNYTTEEYCADVVDAVQAVCAEAEVQVPTIVTESGRAVSAYSSVLLFNILDINRLDPDMDEIAVPDDAPPSLVALAELARGGITAKNVLEAFHDALYYRDDIRGTFLHGELNIRSVALADRCFWRVLRTVSTIAARLKRLPEELQNLDEHMTDIYYGNMSIFQSLPDAWAIEQLFPIMPIHRLAERPRNPAVIADTTCDSDGKIDRFTDLHDVKQSLILHDLIEGEPYILGAFLVGAYQETLGSLHNLFGDTNVVSLAVNESGGIDYQREVTGDSVGDVLSYVEYDPEALVTAFRDKLERAAGNGALSQERRSSILAAYEEGIGGYTYYETDNAEQSCT